MKIIVSNKARNHMEAHKNDFSIPWKHLIECCENKKEVKEMKKDFEIVEVEFKDFIGFCKLVEIEEKDEVVYGRRIGRDIYSKFIKNVKPHQTNKLTLILKKSYKKPNEYYLITMFPGSKNYKEPEDTNIADRRELYDSLSFWNKHALIYEEDTVDLSSLKNYCPYKNLYLATS